MKNETHAETTSLGSFLFGTVVLLSICCAVSCGSGGKHRFITARQLEGRLDTSELTPIEIKRIERVLNSEVSPCGDNVTLAEALSNTEHCPLAALAGRFVVGRIMQDYNEQEISEAYLARYAALKGLEISADGAPRLGDPDAPVTLVVFTDFRCPFCAKAAERTHELYRLYQDTMSVVYKAYPLAMHPGADLAARAGYAAHRQDAFWQMHDTIFSAHATQLDEQRLKIMAIGLGLDEDRFVEDMDSPGALAAIQADRAQGEKLGVLGTPSFFVNGRPHEHGVKGLEERILEEILRQQVAIPTS